MYSYLQSGGFDSYYVGLAGERRAATGVYYCEVGVIHHRCNKIERNVAQGLHVGRARARIAGNSTAFPRFWEHIVIDVLEIALPGA